MKKTKISKQDKSLATKLSTNFKTKGILAVDLDGTLAKEVVPYTPNTIGRPVPLMLKRVKQQLKDGRTVWIFTARMSSTAHTPEQLHKNKALIKAYCKAVIGRTLPVTAEKHPHITEYWDNKSRQVETDTGKFVVQRAVHAAMSYTLKEVSEAL